MNLTPWRRNREMSSGSAFPELSLLRSEMDNLFDQFFRGSRLQPLTFGRKGEWLPTLDVKENEKEITVKCDVPGVDARNIDVSLSGDLLTIKGEKKAENVEDSDDYYIAERSVGTFLRTIQLPDSVDSDSIKAEQKDGVLTIQLKKRPGAGQKKIPIAVNK